MQLGKHFFIYLLLIGFGFISSFDNRAYGNGNRVGNGGDVVECGGTYYLLDFYEADVLSLETTAEGAWGVAKSQLQKIVKLNRGQGEQYLQRLETLKDAIEFKDNVALKDIKDSQHLIDFGKSSCQLHQVAIRKNITGDESNRFIVDRKLFEKLPVAHQAGLLIHEIVYEHFYKLGEQDSRKAREFTAMLFKNKFDKMSPVEYSKIFTNWKLPIYR